jgi:hypothetical protein
MLALWFQYVVDDRGAGKAGYFSDKEERRQDVIERDNARGLFKTKKGQGKKAMRRK